MTLRPKVPTQRTVNTGDEGPIHEMVDQFFEATMTWLGYENQSRVFCETKWVGFTTDRIDQEVVASDDYARLLLIRDVLVASMIARRTNSNFVQCSFAIYLDCNETVQRIRWKLPD